MCIYTRFRTARTRASATGNADSRANRRQIILIVMKRITKLKRFFFTGKYFISLAKDKFHQFQLLSHQSLDLFNCLRAHLLIITFLSFGPIELDVSFNVHLYFITRIFTVARFSKERRSRLALLRPQLRRDSLCRMLLCFFSETPAEQS